jgi:hypothetical protein
MVLPTIMRRVVWVAAPPLSVSRKRCWSVAVNTGGSDTDNPAFRPFMGRQTKRGILGEGRPPFLYRRFAAVEKNDFLGSFRMLESGIVAG